MVQIGRALLFGLAIALVGPAPARATIIRAGADAREDQLREAASHAAGAGFKGVAGIYLMGPDRWPPRGSGTGVYIGPSRDGRKGLLLTAAHLFQYDPEAKAAPGYERIAITFGPDLDACLWVDVERVVIHPRFTQAHKEALRGPEAALDLLANSSDDLAILEFDLAAHGKNLELLGVTPAVLHQGGADLADPSLAGQVVGFGVFGTNLGPLSTTNVRVHAGSTLVSYGEFRGNRVFTNWSPMTQGASELLEAGKVAPDLLCRFGLAETRFQARSLLDPTPRLIQTHADHVLPAHGDSGGPLFLAAPGGLQLAGISSRSENCTLFRCDDQQKVRAIVSVWEPVPDHLAWIQEVRDGVPASRVLELKRGPRKAGVCNSRCVIL